MSVDLILRERKGKYFMKDNIIKVLRQINADGDFESSENFMEEGLLDSFDVVDLVSGLEDEFSIEISGRDILPEYFVNLEAIEALVRRYMEGK